MHSFIRHLTRFFLKRHPLEAPKAKLATVVVQHLIYLLTVTLLQDLRMTNQYIYLMTETGQYPVASPPYSENYNQLYLIVSLRRWSHNSNKNHVHLLLWN